MSETLVLTEDEKRIVLEYRMLNDQGQGIIRGTVTSYLPLFPRKNADVIDFNSIRREAGRQRQQKSFRGFGSSST